MEDSQPNMEKYYGILPSKKFRVSVELNPHLQFRKRRMTMRVESDVNARHYSQENNISFDEDLLHSNGIEYISEQLCYIIEQTIRELVYEIMGDLIKGEEYERKFGNDFKNFYNP